MADNSPHILDRVRRLIAAPVFADDEKTRIASLLNVILLVILTLIVLFSLGALLIDPGSITGALPEAVILVLAVGLLFLMRRGQVRLAAFVLCAALWAIITGGTWSSGGLGGTGASSYFGVILIAGLLLGGWAGVVFGLLSIAGGAAMLYADLHQLLPSVPSYHTSIYVWTEFAVTVVGVTGLLYLSTRSLNQAIQRARRNERERAESNRELIAARASLELHNQQLRSTVQRYVDYMAVVGRGDLSTRLALDPQGHTDDALYVLGCSLNETVASLGRMIAELREAAGALRSATAQILAATSQQAGGASQQSAAIAETTTTVDEVHTIANQAVTRAQALADAAQRTVEVSRSGQDMVQDAIHSMGRIKDQVEGIAANILTLSRHTQQIGDIIATVADLASQSNLLALNAAVEAARAGEHGKGFSVVAAEVRSLAEQSRQATVTVRSILNDIQKATNATVMATEEGTKRVDEGVQRAARASDAIRHLAGVIDESAQAAIQLAAGGREQATGIDQIALAMQAINQATVQSLASTRQAERSAQDLNDLARRLAETVEQYRL